MKEALPLPCGFFIIVLDLRFTKLNYKDVGRYPLIVYRGRGKA
jgi:hypothetical protein